MGLSGALTNRECRTRATLCCLLPWRILLRHSTTSTGSCGPCHRSPHKWYQCRAGQLGNAGDMCQQQVILCMCSTSPRSEVLQRKPQHDHAFSGRNRRAWLYINVMLLVMAPSSHPADRVAATLPKPMPGGARGAGLSPIPGRVWDPGAHARSCHNQHKTARSSSSHQANTAQS